MAKVDTTNKIYNKQQPKRDLFHAVKGGTDTMQEGNTTYLPKYPAEDSGDYSARLKSSTIDGLVAGGCDTLSGAVFYGDIDTSKVNTAIVPLLENIDNKGNHFNVFARQAFDAAFDGHAVILIDRPKVDKEKVKSLDDQKQLGIRTYWRLYFAKDVRNWRYRVNPVSKATELEFIVFHEPQDEPDEKNPFAVKTVDYYRVYYKDGLRWELYKKNSEAKTDEERFTLMESGALEGFTDIPVAIVGCLDDEPRLLVESRLEVKAYQKESSFDAIEYLSVPQMLLVGRDTAQLNKPIPYGPSTVIDVPIGGDGKFISIDSAGHDSLKGSIQNIKEYIKSRLNELTSNAMQSAEKTATQANIEDRDKQARLIVWADQFKDALELALGFTAESMGLGRDKGGEIVLNTKWEVAKQQAEEAKQMQAQADMANIEAMKAKAGANG